MSSFVFNGAGDVDSFLDLLRKKIDFDDDDDPTKLAAVMESSLRGVAYKVYSDLPTDSKGDFNAVAVALKLAFPSNRVAASHERASERSTRGQVLSDWQSVGPMPGGIVLHPVGSMPGVTVPHPVGSMPGVTCDEIL
eukprot:m.224567 g.224567  ORF g.224567 m.224567 type:complete len:137 (+) comp39996_c0_seq27:158-568(+)